MARKYFLILILFVPIHVLFPQQLQRQPHGLGLNAAAGGIDQPRFQFVDIDGDHDLDLFLLDNDSYLWFYRSADGFLSQEENAILSLDGSSWFRFIDIDHDGDQDCFTSGTFSEVALYTNTGTSSVPKFQLTSAALLDTSGTALFSERFSIPAFADIDADGDDDFFSGGSIGSVSFYKNIGTPSSPQFTFITSSFGGINIQGGSVPFPKAMHGASGLEFFDADSNGVLDLFWGDYFNQSLYYLKNIGTKQNALLTLVDSTYPNEAVIQSYGFNVPQHADIDGNGTADLMVGSIFPTTEYDNFSFYRNVGTNAAPFYVLQTKNFIPMIDAGSRSNAAAADLDGDGDFDLAVGSALGKIQFHDNTGTVSAPSFHAQPQSSLLLENNFYAAVTAGDLTGDGKPDLLIGNYDGRIRAFANTTTDGVISFAQITYPLDQYDAGQNSAPCIVDIDGNGVLDLLVGSSGGEVVLLKNSGTNAAPVFTADAGFSVIDVGNDAIPFAADIDNDGVMDLLIGNSEGTVFHYKRSPLTTNKFELVTDRYRSISLNTQSAPCMADMDADGDRDLILGNGKGGLFYYRNVGPLPVPDHSPEIPSFVEVHQNYPNPFNPATTITFSLPEAAHVAITVYDMLGRKIETLTNVNMNSGKHSVVWNAKTAPSGTYLCRCIVSGKSGQQVIDRRMSLIK
jgi:hypothetical protein